MADGDTWVYSSSLTDEQRARVDALKAAHMPAAADDSDAPRDRRAAADAAFLRMVAQRTGGAVASEKPAASGWVWSETVSAEQRVQFEGMFAQEGGASATAPAAAGAQSTAADRKAAADAAFARLAAQYPKAKVYGLANAKVSGAVAAPKLQLVYFAVRARGEAWRPLSLSWPPTPHPHPHPHPTLLHPNTPTPAPNTGP